MPTKTFDSGPPPDHPHFVCRDGYWWHHDPNRHVCYRGAIALLVDDLEKCFYGSPLKRGERINKLSYGELDALFLEKCVCGSNHRIAADNLARAYRAIPVRLHDAAQALGAQNLIALATIRGEAEEDTTKAMALEIARMAASGYRRRRRPTDEHATPESNAQPGAEQGNVRRRRGRAAKHQPSEAQ